MSGVESSATALAGLLLIAIVALVVLRPILSGEPERDDRGVDERFAALEAAKEAKYREIRDAEFDLRMGKLSEADHRAIDRDLRAQAIEILRAIDDLEGHDRDEATQ